MHRQSSASQQKTAEDSAVGLSVYSVSPLLFWITLLANLLQATHICRSLSKACSLSCVRAFSCCSWCCTSLSWRSSWDASATMISVAA